LVVNNAERCLIKFLRNVLLPDSAGPKQKIKKLHYINLLNQLTILTFLINLKY
jgi:hypothetical protein